MAVSTTTLAIRYNGNGSTSTPYSIPFPFLETGHVFAATETVDPLGEVNEPEEGFTDFQFKMVQSLEKPEPAAGDVIRWAAAATPSVYSRNYKIALVELTASDVSTRTYTVTIDSDDAADFFTNDEDGDQIYIIGDAVTLGAGDFTVTALDDHSGGTLTTASAVSTSDTLLIWREVPLTQPTVFQTAGPFPAKSSETAFDRLTMQVQQLNQRLNQLEGTASDAFIHLPGDDPQALRDVMTFANSTARGAATPKFIGQIGVQLDEQSIWIAQSLGAGSWKQYKLWQKEWRVYGPDDYVPAEVSARYVGTITEPLAIKSLFVAFASGMSDGIVISVSAGDVEILAGTTFLSPPLSGGDGARACAFPDEIIPVGTVITIDISIPDYGGGVKGLDLVLNCATF